jgi:hypothetical protein
MGESDTMPDDAFDFCTKCGLQFVMHEITAYGAALHPLNGLDDRYDGKVCVDNDG